MCGAEYGTRSPDRANRRNGYRHRDLDTRVGTIDVAIPKLREGSFFPDWLLRAAPAGRGGADHGGGDLLPARGVAPGGWTSWSQSLGITGLSKSQVSEMAKDLDEQVAAFRTRPLDDGPYTFVAADALTMKVREGGRVVKVAVMVATGVNADGLPGGPRDPRRHHRVRRRLAGVLPRPGRPRPVRGRAGHLRRARRPGRGDRGDPARRGLAAVPHPLRREPDGA